MNRFHPSNFRHLIGKGIEFIRQPDVILFIVLNVLMLAFLKVNAFRFGYNLGIFLFVPILLFQYVPAVAVALSAGFAYAMYRRGIRKTIGQFTHLLLGRGWDAWAMFWMWCIFIAIMPNPLSSTMSFGVGSIASTNPLYSLEITNIAILIGLSIFQFAARKAGAFPKRDAVIAIITTVVLSIAFGEVIQPFLRSISANLNAVDSMNIASLLWGGISIAMMIFIISRRIGFGFGLRLISLVAGGAILINLILFRPVYDWIFLNFVPTIMLDSVSVDNALIQALASSAVVVVLIGALSAIWIRSSSIRGRTFIGALVGALVGLSASAVVGGWAAGTAGQSSLYGFVLSRVGYNDAEWVLKLGIAVNDTLSLTILESLLSAISGALLAGLGGFIIPIRQASKPIPDNIPLWTIVAMIAVPMLQVGVLTIVTILNLLAPTINNIIVPYNVESIWNPDWTAPAMSAVIFAVELGLILALRRWIYQTHLQTNKPANVVFLNTLFISGLLLAFVGFLQAISVPTWWSILISMIAIGMGIEIVSLSREIPKDEQPLSNRRRWVSAGMMSGMIVIVLNWVLIAAALSMVLIAVVLIVDLSKTTEPPPGIDYLLETLEIHIVTQSSMLFLVWQFFIFMTGFITSLLVLNVPANFINVIIRMGRIIYTRLPIQMQNESLIHIVGFSIVAVIDIFVLRYPVLTGLYMLLFLRRDHLLRLPFWLQASILGIVGVFLLGVALQIELVGMTATIATYIVGVSLLMSYYLIGFHASATQRYSRTLSFTLGLGIVLGLVTVLQIPIVSGNGGISKNTEGNWTVYNQENSTVGTNLPTAILARQDGSMWFANSGGVLSVYDNDSWKLASVSEILDNVRDQVSTNDVLVHLPTKTPYLLERTDGTVWYASGHEMGRIVVNPQGIGAYSLDSMCDKSIIQLTATSDNTFCNGMNQADFPDYESLAMTDDGDLWFTLDGAAYRLVAGDIVALPFESIPVELPDFELTPTATAIVEETATQALFPTRTPTRIPIAIDADVPMQGLLVDIVVNDIATVGDEVWLATNMGLYRFVDDSNQPELVTADSQAVSLVEFSDGAIWFVTTDGVNRVNDGNTETVIPMTMIQSLLGTPQVTALASDSASDILWIGTNRGLIRYASADDNLVYTAENSGLAVNHVLDIVPDRDGNVWVSTYESIESSSPSWIPLLIVIGFATLVGGGFTTDYNNTPRARGKRMARHLADSPNTLAEDIHHYLASDPHTESVNATITQLNQDSLPYGGALLDALNATISADLPQLGSVLTALDAFPESSDTSPISAYYRILMDVLDVQSVVDIASLELRVIPGQDSESYGIVTHHQQLQSVPDFLSLQSSALWNTLQTISITAGKFGQVNDTGDRLSYLAGALVEIESAQAQTATSSLTPLAQAIFRGIINRWRNIIADTISSISGRADLQVELRTRQIKRGDQTSLVLMLENTGQSAAENIRITLIDDEGSSVSENNNIHLERLSPNRKETVEYTLVVPQVDTMRVVFMVMWDDRLEKDKSIEFADQIRFFDTKTEFKPIENPYIVGHPVKQSEMFFGREDVFQFIDDNLSGSVQDRTIVIYGQRRTGKTSLLYQLINGRLGEKYLAVLVDMQAVVLLVDSTADFLGEILYQIELSLEETDITIDVPTIDDSTQSPMRVFDRFLTRLSKDLGERRILLIFDEFELIESEIQSATLDSNLLGYFRSLIQHRDSLVFIFAGTHRLDEMSHDYWSILFNIALSCQITFMTEADTINLIREPVKEYLSIDDLAVEKIMRLTNGHPYFTQLLCWALVNHCNAAQHNYATINDVNSAVDLILTTGESHFAYIWQQSTPQEQLILAIIAHSTTTTGWMTLDDITAKLQELGISTYSNSDLIDLIDSLVHHEIIEVTVISSTRYRFQLEVLRVWVRYNRSVETIVERLKHS